MSSLSIVFVVIVILLLMTVDCFCCIQNCHVSWLPLCFFAVHCRLKITVITLVLHRVRMISLEAAWDVRGKVKLQSSGQSQTWLDKLLMNRRSLTFCHHEFWLMKQIYLSYVCNVNSIRWCLLILWDLIFLVRCVLVAVVNGVFFWSTSLLFSKVEIGAIDRSNVDDN